MIKLLEKYDLDKVKDKILREYAERIMENW